MAPPRLQRAGPADDPHSARNPPTTGRRPATPVILHRGSWIIRSRPDGSIDGPARDGFFVDDTRLISSLTWRLGGAVPQALRRRRRGNDSTTFLLAGRGATVELARSIDADGLLELVTVIAPEDGLATSLDLSLEADFADMFEVRGLAPHRARGTQLTWSPDLPGLRATYRHGTFERGVAVLVEKADGPTTPTARGLRFDVEVDGGRRWSAQMRIGPGPARPRSGVPATASEHVRRPRISSPDPSTARIWTRALIDLESLELEDEDPQRGCVAPAAGIPWYAALFGRDSLICTIQALSVRPDLARGTLCRLAALQATGDDPAREMEPGKIPHELPEG